MTHEIERRFDLHAARVNGGDTVRSLAAKVGIDYRTLKRIEDGLPVHPAKAKLIADYFEVRVTDLLPADARAAA
jgi:transcriptional regulator with XRE-family HTH domain